VIKAFTQASQFSDESDKTWYYTYQSKIQTTPIVCFLGLYKKASSSFRLNICPWAGIWSDEVQNFRCPNPCPWTKFMDNIPVNK